MDVPTEATKARRARRLEDILKTLQLKVDRSAKKDGGWGE